MKNNGIKKEDIYLYPDGIYLRESMHGYSYPKQVVPLDLSNVSALVDYIEKGKPADEFRTVLDSDNYANYHKVPWKVIMKLMLGSYYLFQTNNNVPGAVLFGFIFQKFSENSQMVEKRDSQGNIEYEQDEQGQTRLDENGNPIPIMVLDNQDDFKIVIPHQTLNDPGTSKQIMSDDAELRSYVNNDEYVYVGQFIFVNEDPNGDVNRQIDIALHNTPQNVYVFNHFSDAFNFAHNFGGLRILPTFNKVSNGALSSKPLSAREVYNYLSIPIDIKRNNGNVGINNDIDMSGFYTSPEYVYLDGNLRIKNLLDKASDETLDEFKQWGQKVSLDESPSMDEALREAQVQHNSVTPSDVTNEGPQQAPSDMVNAASAPQQTQATASAPQSNAQPEPQTTEPTQSAQPTNNDNAPLQGLSEADLLGDNSNTTYVNPNDSLANEQQVENTQNDLVDALDDDDLLNGINGSGLGGATVTNNSEPSKTAQDIIDETPADERFITNQDGNPVFYAQTHKNKPSASDRQREAYVDHDISAQHEEMMSKAKNNPELGNAMKNLMNGRP